ncbi:MAG TPA: dihydroxyacetone kinase subunit DhaL [Candidatus Limnocylindria bacterium]|nr:dihydroxyacetone kinase subunit DhaL [Candidatus Limnocylindria bacterium]
MGFTFTTADYADYLQRAAARIAAQKDYVSALDAATGDGDHWANLNLGFGALLEQADALRGLGFSAMFRKIGMTLMSRVGGSSGILYGGGYQAAGRAMPEGSEATLPQLAEALSAMLADMMKRGQAQPGFKTMIDALHPAVGALKEALESGEGPEGALSAMRRAALAGAEATRGMEAVKGRASYQADKGVGHLDPGAVTMAWQLDELGAALLGKGAA